MIFKKLIFCVFLILICVGIYQNNSQNYTIAQEIQHNIIEHPENLPDSDLARVGSFGFQNMVADIYWLQAIQYIGGNAAGWEYKQYLFLLLQLISDMSPYFENPYVTWILLLPSENIELVKNTEEAEILWLKGIEKNCDITKINAIFTENDMWKIISQTVYENPCRSYKIPYYLAYFYYESLQKPNISAQFYKVVAAQTDAPEGAKLLAWIMQGKGGQREKALSIFSSLAQSRAWGDELCISFANTLEQVYFWLEKKSIELTGELIESIQIRRKQLQSQEASLWNIQDCSKYIFKATRELNLMYLDTTYGKAQIDFIPTDYQEGMIYTFDEEIWGFDVIFEK